VKSNNNIEFVSISEVKNILKKVEEERKELTYEQRIALEHARKFGKLPISKIKNMIKDLKKLDFLEENHTYMIVDLIPTKIEDVKTIFAKERITLDDNKIKNILDIVNKYYIE
jgi:DNA-directed RNA polymerase subunit F